MRVITAWRDSLLDALARRTRGQNQTLAGSDRCVELFAIVRSFEPGSCGPSVPQRRADGLLLLPVPGTAYDSVDYAQFNVPFGDVVRGLHYYAANLLLVTLGLHALRGFLVGAYKHPRQYVWASGIVILLVVVACLITGALLPWDQNAYWTTQVRLSMVSAVPLVGEFFGSLSRAALGLASWR